MGRGAAAAAPHDVLIWAAPHPRRIFCDPAAQGLWICHCEAPTGPWQSRRTILDNRQVSANTVTLRGVASRTPPPTRCVRSAIHGAKRQCLPEIATGAKRPRNDNSGAGAVLAIACSDRQHCAGRGMPLPYNAQLAASQNYPFSIIHLPRALSRFLQYYPSSPAAAFSVRMRRTLSSMRVSVSVPSAAASRRACRAASRSSGIRMRSQPASMASRAASPGV